MRVNTFSILGYESNLLLLLIKINNRKVEKLNETLNLYDRPYMWGSLGDQEFAKIHHRRLVLSWVRRWYVKNGSIWIRETKSHDFRYPLTLSCALILHFNVTGISVFCSVGRDNLTKRTNWLSWPNSNSDELCDLIFLQGDKEKSGVNAGIVAWCINSNGTFDWRFLAWRQEIRFER